MNYLHLTILWRVWVLPSLTTLILRMKNTLNATACLKPTGFLYIEKMWPNSKFILSWKLQFCMLLWTQPCDAFLLILQSIIRGNLQYASLSALRRLPLDPGNPAFLHRAVQGWVWTYFRSIIDLILWTFVISQLDCFLLEYQQILGWEQYLRCLVFFCLYNVKKTILIHSWNSYWFWFTNFFCHISVFNYLNTCQDEQLIHCLSVWKIDLFLQKIFRTDSLIHMSEHTIS